MPARLDIRPLGWSRAALGTLFLLRTTPILAPFHIWFLQGTWPLLGWPDGRWSAPPPSFTLPYGLVVALCLLRTACALAFTLGIGTRLAGLTAGVSGYLVLSQDPFAFINTLHLLFLGTMVLACTDAGSSFALRPNPARTPASSFALVRIFLASIYLWASIAKLHGDWLDGRILALFEQDGAFCGPLAAFLLSTPVRRTMVAWVVAMTELALGPLLLWSRTRVFGVALAFAFHAGIELTTRPDLLGWEMAALLIACWPVRSPAGELQRSVQSADVAGQPIKP